MKIMKRLISGILLAALVAACLTSLPALRLEAKAASESDLTFKLNSTKDGYIITDCAQSAAGELVIPATYNGLPVQEIAANAFQGCTKLTAVTIPDSVKAIGSGAFSGCSGLVSLTLPFIGDKPRTQSDTYKRPLGYLFGGTSYTGGVQIQQAVYSSDIDTVGWVYYYIPESLKSVTVTGEDDLRGAFSSCSGLTSITIPSNATVIGDYAFYQCAGLTEFTIPAGVTSIGKNAFYDCTGLTELTIPEGVTSMGYAAIMGCTGLTELTVPDSVTSLGNRAFMLCTGLKSIKLPNNLSTIGEDTLWGCKSLTKLTIPGSVKSIEDLAMGYLTLEEIYFEGSAPEMGIDVFKNVTATAYYYPDSTWTSDVMQDYGGDITWTARELAYTLSADGTYYTVSGIGTCADTDLVIPATYKGLPVKEIGASAFRDNTAITSVTIPEGVKAIGNYAFSGCTGLTSLTLPDSLQTIGQSAFNKCSGLASVSIPNNVESIGYHAFYSCPKLSYTVYDNAKYLGNAENPYLVLVQATSEAISSCAVHPDTRILYSEAFFCCAQLTELTVPKGVVEVGPYLFDASGVKKLFFDGSAPSFAKYAFFGVSATAYYCPDSTWTEDVMQNYGGTITWVPMGSDVKLSITSFGAAADPVTAVFTPSGETEAAYTLTTADSPANFGVWTLSGVKPGTYTVTLWKKNHVKRSYTLTVGDAEASLEAQLWLLGDVNGDGRVNYRDYGMTLSQIKNPGAGTLEGYALACADANGDGKANYIDYGMILAQAKGKSPLW